MSHPIYFMSRSIVVKALTALVASAVILHTTSAQAESYTLDDGDQRLYVRVVTNNVIAGFANSGSAVVYSGPVSNIVIYKGNVPITDDRFVNLLSSKGVGRQILAEAGNKNAAGWLAVGMAAGGLGYALTALGKTGSDGLGTYFIGSSIIALALIPLHLSEGRPFTTEDAVEAVREYNARL